MNFHEWIIAKRSKRPPHDNNPFAILETVFDDNEMDCSADLDADAFKKWITKESTQTKLLIQILRSSTRL